MAALMLSACSDPASTAACEVPTNFTWSASDVLVAPRSDAEHELVSIKDPTVVRFEDRWHVYATTANTAGEWSLVYLSFEDWEDAKDAPFYYMDQTPGFEGYMAAPHVFYFEPHAKWYLVFQTQPPAYSTTDDVSDPTSWTAPQPFFSGKPRSAPDLWIDYWVICDGEDCFLFFTGDNGALYRSQTSRDAFPEGMSDPVLVMRQSTNELFEGSAHYKIEGMDKYLTLVEAIGPEGVRYYKAWTADALDGAWTPIQSDFDRPFAGETNVSFSGEPWTRDISHGELVRSGYDERMTVDLCSGNMQFLFQGQDHEIGMATSDYSQKPYRLGLLTQGPSDPGVPPLDLPPTPAEPFPETPTGENLLANAGFEDGSNGWVPWGASLSTVEDPVHGGSLAGRATGRTESWNGAGQDIFSETVPGRTYFASIWVTVGREGASETEPAPEPGASTGEIEGSSGTDGTGEMGDSTGGGESSSGTEGTGGTTGSGGTSSAAGATTTGSGETSSGTGDTLAPQPVALSLKATCGTEESYSSVATGEVAPGTWIELSGTFDTPSCEDLAELVLYAEGPPAGIDLYLDDASVSE